MLSDQQIQEKLDEWEKVSPGWQPVQPGTRIKIHPEALSAPDIRVTAEQYQFFCEHSPYTPYHPLSPAKFHQQREQAEYPPKFNRKEVEGMGSIKVKTCLTGMDELENSVSLAKEAADKLDDAVLAVRRAICNVGLIVEQPPADTEG